MRRGQPAVPSLSEIPHQEARVHNCPRSPAQDSGRRSGSGALRLGTACLRRLRAARPSERTAGNRNAFLGPKPQEKVPVPRCGRSLVGSHQLRRSHGFPVSEHHPASQDQDYRVRGQIGTPSGGLYPVPPNEGATTHPTAKQPQTFKGVLGKGQEHLQQKRGSLAASSRRRGRKRVPGHCRAVSSLISRLFLGRDGEIVPRTELLAPGLAATASHLPAPTSKSGAPQFHSPTPRGSPNTPCPASTEAAL